MSMIPTPVPPVPPTAPLAPNVKPLDMSVLRPSRPLLYTVLGVLNILSLLFGLAGVYFLFLLLSAFPDGKGGVVFFSLVFAIPLGISLLSIYGFFKMKKYMPMLTKVMAGLYIALNVTGLTVTSSGLDLRSSLSMLLTLLIVLSITYRIHQDRALFVN